MHRLLVLTILATAIAAAPAHAAGGLMGAYETYVSGSGFEIRLVNVSSGAQITVPSGVNTSADELHPTLSHDGRYLVFMRTQLVPTLTGDIIPPAARTLVIADRSTGTVTTLSAAGESASGPSFSVTATPSTTGLAWGVPHQSQTISFCCETFAVSANATFVSGALSNVASLFTRIDRPDAGASYFTTHAMNDVVSDFSQSESRTESALARYVTVTSVNPSTGALIRSVAHITTTRPGFNISPDGQTRTIGDATAPAAHPAQRPADNFVALYQVNGSEADIKTLTFPATTNPPTAPETAPAPITTADPERMPAWSPDSLRLGFVRTVAARRKLAVFDLTPGIQAPLNTPIDMGLDAPTAQLRSYQAVWGGLSLAALPATSSPPLIECDRTCVNKLEGAKSTTTLSPKSTSVSVGTQIGIFVVRVTGRRTLLGVKVPRIKVIGRVPLGKLSNGRASFRWPAKVNGKRLKRGTYLLTFRSLRGTRVLSTSGSVRFKVGRDGRITRAGRERSPLE
jgi:hypothetical protein